jgi:hypothetical protein
MSAPTAAPDRTISADVPAATPTPEGVWTPPRPAPSPWTMAFALAIPVATVAALMARLLARQRAASKPSVDWKLMSGNSLTFSPRFDCHPVFFGRRQHPVRPARGIWRRH